MIKPGLFPAEYLIPAADDKKLGILTVNDGTRGIYLDQERGTENVNVDGRQIARSIVEDFVIGQPAQDQTSGPGLFHVEGVHDSDGVRTKFHEKIVTAEGTQREWWRRLVRLADDAWQHSHIIAQIGDLERYACRQLGLKRDWLDDNPDSILKCPVCTTLISTSAIVCFACKVILKSEEYGKFQFAGGSVQALNTKV